MRAGRKTFNLRQPIELDSGEIKDFSCNSTGKEKQIHYLAFQVKQII
jgi:hypothetical protein